MRRAGPGVDLQVPIHHAVGGLLVQAVEVDGERGVRVMCTNGELPVANGSNLRFDATLTMDEWASLDKAARELPTTTTTAPQPLARHDPDATLP